MGERNMEQTKGIFQNNEKRSGEEALFLYHIYIKLKIYIQPRYLSFSLLLFHF